MKKTIDQQIKEYLKKNLTIKVDTNSREEGISGIILNTQVTILLDNEVLTTDSHECYIIK